jgi:hypothetical protein
MSLVGAPPLWGGARTSFICARPFWRGAPFTLIRARPFWRDACISFIRARPLWGGACVSLIRVRPLWGDACFSFIRARPLGRGAPFTLNHGPLFARDAPLALADDLLRGRDARVALVPVPPARKDASLTLVEGRLLEVEGPVSEKAARLGALRRRDRNAIPAVLGSPWQELTREDRPAPVAGEVRRALSPVRRDLRADAKGGCVPAHAPDRRASSATTTSCNAWRKSSAEPMPTHLAARSSNAVLE